MKIAYVAIRGALQAHGTSACSTNPTHEQIGTGVGATVGGALDHVITGRSAMGTIAGAAAGALIGKEIGKKQDKDR